jgi:hypothetical protein
MKEFTPGERRGDERRNKEAIRKEIAVTGGTGNQN